MCKDTTAKSKKLPLIKTPTKDMTKEQWLAARQKSIGGSDAAAILNLSQYNSPFALWCEKTGRIVPEDISDVEAVRLGNDFEQYVAERFMEATGKKVRRENYIIQNPEYPFAHANVDRLVVGENAGLECKTTSSFEIAKQCAANEIPKHFYVQCVHYMMVTGADRWYLAVLVYGKGFYWFTIERNQFEIDALVFSEKLFWQKVQDNTPPDVDGTDSTSGAIKTIFTESDGTTCDLLPILPNLQALASLKKQRDDVDESISFHENSIKMYMGDAEKGSYGNYSVSWKSSSRKTFDRKKFESVNGPIDPQYFTESVTRTFKFVEKGNK